MPALLCTDLVQVVRELQHSRNGVTVITEDGCRYEANYVVLSVSIGVLQSDLISFRPPLPVRFVFHFFNLFFYSLQTHYLLYMPVTARTSLPYKTWHSLAS
jgi:hypothetical protein